MPVIPVRAAGWRIDPPVSVPRPSGDMPAAMAAAALTPWTRRNFARWLWEDYPRAILGTPDRWHRGMLTPPGAWVDATR